MNSNPILQCLQVAEDALRSNLHRHDLDEIARAHMERALNHTREAYVATNEIGKARTVERLVGDLEKVERLTERLRKRQPDGVVVKSIRH